MDIKKSIKRHGWSLSELAKEMTDKDGNKGVSQPTMSIMVNGNPTINKLKEIADIMGITVSELLSEDERPAQIICPHCGKVIKIKVE